MEHFYIKNQFRINFIILSPNLLHHKYLILVTFFGPIFTRNEWNQLSNVDILLVPYASSVSYPVHIRICSCIS
jgi:hypothetical protein